MSTLLPVSLLESLGVQVVQEAADAAFGPGVLTVSTDSNGLTTGFKFSSGQTVNLDDLQAGAQGLSGRLWIDGLTANPLSATLGDGFDVSLTTFDLTLANGSLANVITPSTTVPVTTTTTPQGTTSPPTTTTPSSPPSNPPTGTTPPSSTGPVSGVVVGLETTVNSTVFGLVNALGLGQLVAGPKS